MHFFDRKWWKSASPTKYEVRSLFFDEKSMKIAKNRVGRIPQPYLRLYGTEIFVEIMIFRNFIENLCEIPWHVYGVFAQFREIGEFLEVTWFLGPLRKQANSRAECKEISGALRVSEKMHDFMWIHRPLHPQGKTKAKWAVRNCWKSLFDWFSGEIMDFSYNVMVKVLHLGGRLKALRHFR